MRISDWSSDVCSSDLAQRRRIAGGDVDQAGLVAHQDLAAGHLVEAVDGAQQGRLAGAGEPHEDADLALLDGQRGAGDADDVVGLGQDLVARRALVEQRQGLLRLLARSEEHTSELQSLMRISYAVFCLKKKK